MSGQSTASVANNGVRRNIQSGRITISRSALRQYRRQSGMTVAEISQYLNVSEEVVRRELRRHSMPTDGDLRRRGQSIR